eukprot:TRINITY_DN5753_c0_g1_i1.p1 TRINITY_DN5753_c0_g1~~TRINITY_DN5753_c0_g1_i1.p1  ORF type:complete len:174 (-),score=26.73 TRINITY_DN5753_c0_g1_i1:9-530(-)
MFALKTLTTKTFKKPSLRRALHRKGTLKNSFLNVIRKTSIHPRILSKKAIFYRGIAERTDVQTKTSPLYQYHTDGKRVFTRKEVALHNSETDGWIVISNKVYNVTTWLEFHPGGAHVLKDKLGQEATEEFLTRGHSWQARDIMQTFHIGWCFEKPRYNTLDGVADQTDDVFKV